MTNALLIIIAGTLLFGSGTMIAGFQFAFWAVMAFTALVAAMWVVIYAVQTAWRAIGFLLSRRRALVVVCGGYMSFFTAAALMNVPISYEAGAFVGVGMLAAIIGLTAALISVSHEEGAF